MNITGHIGTKSTQMFAYADDVAIASRNNNALKGTVVNIESEARKRDFIIPWKALYMFRVLFTPIIRSVLKLMGVKSTRNM
jgi:hypothetical protein